VAPGPIDTPGLKNLLASSAVGAERLKTVITTVPVGRLGAPDEIAKAVVFLASEDSSYVTGPSYSSMAESRRYKDDSSSFRR